MKPKARKNDSLPGSLATLILRTLSPRDLHGYGIAQFIQQSPGHELLIEEGSLYPVLQRLELNGWIDGVWRMTSKNRRARIYRITPAGREQLAGEPRKCGNSTCRPKLAKRSAFFAIAFTSLAASEPPAAYSVLDPKCDCDPVPALIRDAAKDARIPLNVVCYISDRPRFARKAGETFASNLDRVGDMVRVVIPFGHLLVINGTEPAVQMAVRFYDGESRKLLTASRFTREQDVGVKMATLDRTSQGIRALRRSYASLLTPHNQFAAPIGPRSKSSGRK
ncbi:helix-turn-helix transcriptional regulator [uncultured Paludibaculum sp.]|uniref:helix-turn-helix transcriptional regulator n=1 Tax=uncultured Paludibaculum sp. TaxID=1765020 RepID=UPI002AAC1F77|nr:helix-turn-helix transcriptional regulator [uncultured Paludibaculum sp.]